MHTIYYCSSIRSQQRLSVPYKYISMLHTLQDDSLGRSDENTKKKNKWFIRRLLDQRTSIRVCHRSEAHLVDRCAPFPAAHLFRIA